MSLLTVACGGGEDEDEYQYDRADVEAALFGTWQGSWQPADGEALDFELEIRSRDEPGLGPKCGTRALGGSGLSCVSSSKLAVSGTASPADGSEPVELDGSIDIHSLILSEAFLGLAREGAPFSIVAQWNETKGWDFCRAEATGGAIIASCTLTERAPR